MMWGAAPPCADAFTTSSTALWQQLQLRPERIPEELRCQRKTPIGRYFEALVGFWLQQQASISNFHQSLTIQGSDRTLGELDLLFEHDGQAHHWELAVKFYLGVGDLSSASSWHGPRARDRLDKKLEKLVGQQLQLPSHAATQERLAELGMESPQSHAFVKGYLFHPFDRWQDKDVALPSGVGSEHLRGWWLQIPRCDELHSLPAAGWKILEKPDWLAPWRGAWTIPSSELTATLALRVGEYGPTMVAGIGDDGCELHRGFVVPESWAPLT
jgi:hypothetical protein